MHTCQMVRFIFRVAAKIKKNNSNRKIFIWFMNIRPMRESSIFRVIALARWSKRWTNTKKVLLIWILWFCFHKSTVDFKSLPLRKMPIQIYWEFYHQNMKIFRWKIQIFFLISAQKIDCGYSLEPPRWSMLLSRNKKNNVYPCKPQFYSIKVGFMGVKSI